MKENLKEEKLLNILKEAFDDFAKTVYKNRYYIEEQKTLEDEISIIFYVPQFYDIFFKIYIKKQNINLDKIPKIKDIDPLEDIENPYKNLKFTDENYILEKIYESIIQYEYEDIKCYEKYGILIKKPLGIEGIYNINVKCMMKE